MKPLHLFFATLLATIAFYWIACSPSTDEEVVVKYDYVIDLKQTKDNVPYYIVKDNYDNVDTVAFGELEDWFLDDNL